MPRNPTLPFVFFGLLFITWSCITNRVTFSVLEPAAVTLPAKIKRISIFPMPGMYSVPGVFDSLSHFKMEINYNIRDIKMGYLHGIYDILSSSPRFKKVVLSDATKSSVLSGRVYWDDAELICKHDTTDILLVLSRAVSYDELDNSFNQFEVLSDINYRLINNTKWVFYLPAEQKELTRFTFSDTLMSKANFSLVDFDNFLYQACYSSGRNTGTKLSPYWNNVNRFIFTGPGREMKTAARYIMKNQWYDAALIWNTLAGAKNILASRSAYNLALAYERDDVLDQAVLWINYADSLSTGNPRVLSYKKILETRLKTKPKIDEQMTGN